MSSRPRKKAKTDEAEVERPPPDGVIRLEVNNVSTLEGELYSPVVEVKGIPWCIEVTHDVDEERCKLDIDGEQLVAKLDCKYKQTLPWAISVDAEYTLIHPDSTMNLTVKKSYTHRSGKADGPNVEFMIWDDFLMDEKGFIKDEKITVEVRFWIVYMRGFRTALQFDFSDPEEPLHDIALVFKKEKIYVSKQILASHSPVFKAMFYGNFAEKNKNEIKLKDVDRAEFFELLNVIYPSCKEITDGSYKYLLKLGDRFQMMFVMNRVEEFLFRETFTIRLEEKLQLADKYKLSSLQAKCLWKIESYEIDRMKKSPIYKNLSDEMKAALERRQNER